MNLKKFIDKTQWILTLLLILFGLFIVYQLTRKILGGSWNTEDIIIALVVFNIGLTFTIATRLERLNSRHNYLKMQFSHLAKDFKEHMSSE
jgi:hypothetical protein